MADLDLKFGADNPVKEDPLQAKLHGAVRLRESLLAELKATPGLTNSVFLALVMFLNGADELVLARMKSILPRLTANHDGQLLVDDVPFTPMMLFTGATGPAAPQALGGGQPNPGSPANPGAPVPGPQLDADLLAAAQAVQAWAQASGMSVQDFVATYTGIFSGMGRMNPAARTETHRFFGRIVRGELPFARGGHARLQVEEDLDAYTATVKDVLKALTDTAHGDQGVFNTLRDAAIRFIKGGATAASATELADAKTRITELEGLLAGARDFIKGFLRGKVVKRTLVGRGLGTRGNYDANVIIVSTDVAGTDSSALDNDARDKMNDPTRIPGLRTTP